MPSVALVTGSATGVGRACAVRLAQAGFDVVVNYSRSKAEAEETCQLVEAEGRQAWLIACDVSDDQQVRTMLAQIEAECGRLDVLVNNAGCTSFIEHSDLEAMTEEIWDRILDVNLKGPFFVTRAAAPLLKQSGKGAVVNVSSVAALSGQGSSIAYCASKGGLNTMTKSLARVLAPAVRVNAVCPGPIETRWLAAWKTKEEVAEWTSTYPIPRASTPDDVADVVMFLCLGNTMMTGQCLTVDGGRTM